MTQTIHKQESIATFWTQPDTQEPEPAPTGVYVPVRRAALDPQPPIPIRLLPAGTCGRCKRPRRWKAYTPDPDEAGVRWICACYDDSYEKMTQERKG